MRLWSDPRAPFSCPETFVYMYQAGAGQSSDHCRSLTAAPPHAQKRGFKRGINQTRIQEVRFYGEGWNEQRRQTCACRG